MNKLLLLLFGVASLSFGQYNNSCFAKPSAIVNFTGTSAVIVPAITGKAVKVCAVRLVPSTAVDISLVNSGTGAVIHTYQNTNAVLDSYINAQLKTAGDQGLSITVSSSTTVKGSIAYIQEAP